MKAIVVGPLADVDGLCQFTRSVQPDLVKTGPFSYRKPPVEVRNHFVAAPLELRSAQRPRLPVSYRHGAQVLGEVLHLERGERGYWALAEVDAMQVPMHEIFWSAELDEQGQLRGASLTPDPAEFLAPVRMLPGSLADQDERKRLMLRKSDPHLAELLGRAIEATKRRRYDSPILVSDQRRHEVTRLPGGLTLDRDGEPIPSGRLRHAVSPLTPAGRGAVRMVKDDEGNVIGPLEIRPCGRILSVR